MNGLKYIREEIIKKSMNELAEQLSVSKQLVYMWESGRKNIPQKRIKQLSELSGIPENYFLVDDITERDKLEIRKHWLDKELDATAVEYDEVVEDSKGNLVTIQRTYLDSGLRDYIEFADMELKILDLQQKIAGVINEYEPEIVDDEDMTTARDILGSMESKTYDFERFANILSNEINRRNTSYTLRAMEQFGKNDVASKEALVEKMRGFIPDTEAMMDEFSLTDALCAIMLLYEKRADEEAKFWENF